jgi:hypothetical protein
MEPTIYLSGPGVSHDAEIRGFTITGSSGIAGAPAIKIVYGACPTVRDNVFENNRAFQSVIEVYGGSALFKSNLFSGNGGLSCIGVFSGEVTIESNTFDGNARGFFSLSPNSSAINNIITNSVEYGIYGQFQQMTYNDVWNNNPDYAGEASPGAQDISVDPWFCDASLLDYRLSSVSPCAGAGPGGVDIGAYSVGCSSPSTCHCPCHSDPLCDGSHDIQDLVVAVDRALRSGDLMSDSSCILYGEFIDGRTDVDCDGDTDILDVVHFVNVAFRNADPAGEFCDPCP